MVEAVEIEVNEKGAKQSKIKIRFDLIDSRVFDQLTKPKYQPYSSVLRKCMSDLHRACTLLRSEYSDYSDILDCIESALHALSSGKATEVFKICAEVMYEGALKYGEDNWKSIEPASHLNHALNHLYLYEDGDQSEAHKAHAVCRMYMAYACIVSQVMTDESI